MSLFDSIIITGGRGMLARAIVEALSARGHSAAALDRNAADITNAKAVRDLFQRHTPTLLINCAAHTKVDLCEQEAAKADAINGYGVGSLAASAREHGTVLVHFSTDFVFDGLASRPYRPSDQVRPLSAYGRSKLLGEQELQRNAPDRWMIIRTAWLYGRGGASFPRTIVERARQGCSLRIVNDQVGSPTYTPDLAEAMLDLLEHQQSGIWHVCNSGQTNWFEFANAALEEFDVSAEISPISTSEWNALRPNQANRPAFSVLDVAPLAQAIGRPTRPWRDALHDFRNAVGRYGWN